MKQACMSNCKDPQNRSNKDCVCGGHSTNDRKKNRNHNSTKSKLFTKKLRKFIMSQKQLDEDFIKVLDEMSSSEKYSKPSKKRF